MNTKLKTPLFRGPEGLTMLNFIPANYPAAIRGYCFQRKTRADKIFIQKAQELDLKPFLGTHSITTW
jgi:hypothetical protein